MSDSGLSIDAAYTQIMQECNSKIASLSRNLVALAIGFFAVLTLLERSRPLSFSFWILSGAYLALVSSTLYELARFRMWDDLLSDNSCIRG